MLSLGFDYKNTLANVVSVDREYHSQLVWINWHLTWLIRSDFLLKLLSIEEGCVPGGVEVVFLCTHYLEINGDSLFKVVQILKRKVSKTKR